MNNRILLEIKMKNTTKNTLLITVATAALMAGAGICTRHEREPRSARRSRS
jgi:hypothetical protein